MMSEELLAEFLGRARRTVDADLDAWLPAPTSSLHDAMRYAVLSGGKRLRPALAFAAAQAVRGAAPEAAAWQGARAVAVAVELVHAYSLVHDDLPAMDDDVERRGRPTVHVKFGEATAILVGDALLTSAFGRLAAEDVRPEHVGPLVSGLAEAAGSEQLVGGQADDLLAAEGTVSHAGIVEIHARKTAALFQFALTGGARAAGAQASELERMREFGLSYGLAFQAADDLLDADPSENSLLRVADAASVRRDVAGYVESGTELLQGLGEGADPLRGLLLSLVERAASG